MVDQVFNEWDALSDRQQYVLRDRFKATPSCRLPFRPSADRRTVSWNTFKLSAFRLAVSV